LFYRETIPRIISINIIGYGTEEKLDYPHHEIYTVSEIKRKGDNCYGFVE